MRFAPRALVNVVNFWQLIHTNSGVYAFLRLPDDSQVVGFIFFNHGCKFFANIQKNVETRHGTSLQIALNRFYRFRLFSAFFLFLEVFFQCCEDIEVAESCALNVVVDLLHGTLGVLCSFFLLSSLNFCSSVLLVFPNA